MFIGEYRKSIGNMRKYKGGGWGGGGREWGPPPLYFLMVSNIFLYHLMKMMNESPDTLKGKKVLFIHTGGVFDLFSGVFASRMNAKSCCKWTGRAFQSNDNGRSPMFYRKVTA